MVLLFPNSASLRMVLCRNAIPVSVSGQPARVFWDGQGSIGIQPISPIPRASLKPLAEFGVTFPSRLSRPLDETVHCWHELIDVDRDSVQLGENPCIWFEIAEGLLPGLTREMQRLGSQRLGFRWLENGKALLRVVNPPTLSLLRACERAGSKVVAYREQRPGVWVEVGYVHPLVSQVQVAPGQFLLIRSPRHWSFVADGPFQDVGAANVPPIPSGTSPWEDRPFQDRIGVALHLVRTTASEPAELWVLQEGGGDQLQQLIDQLDDRIVARLAFAIARRDDQDIVVLRIPPSRQPPPVLVLAGTAFRSYLKLPNLFVPCGTRLQPPLRRDAVRHLLSAAADQIFWLFPHGNGHFVPESLAASVFQPLEQWIDYQRASPDMLSPWQPSSLFEGRALCGG